MITTADVKLKEEKDTKVTILTTDDNHPAEFVVKGKPKKPDERMITTSNVDQRKRELMKEMKKAVDKQKREAAKARKLAKATQAKQEKEAKKNYQMVEVKVKAGKSEPKDLPFSDPGRDE